MTTRDRLVVLALALVVALAGFWFGVLAPKRKEAERIDADIATQQARLDAAQTVAANAAKAREDYREDYSTIARLGKAVPSDDDLPSMLVQLQAAAQGAKNDFRSIKRGAASTDSASAAPAATTATAPASGAAATGTTSASAAAALPPGATVGTAGLATLPFSFTFRGEYTELEGFLRNVQGFVTSSKSGTINVRGRLLTVDGVSLVPQEGDLSRILATVSATAYLQPEGSSSAATTTTPDSGSGSVTAGTTAAPTQTASATPSGAQ